jgi:hypothetical protein
MKNLKRNIAITSTAAILAAVGIGGTVAAQAATDSPTQSVVQSDGDGEVNDATEINDGPDQGPDANPNQPGHQDADETGEAN